MIFNIKSIGVLLKKKSGEKLYPSPIKQSNELSMEVNV